MWGKIFSRLSFLIGTSFMRSYFFRKSDGTFLRFHHRGSRADRGVIKQIFLKKDYSFSKMARRVDLLEAYNSILISKKIPLIIDAGANIGASVVWFSECFGESHIVAIEPDAENVKLLRKNTFGRNVDIHEAALGSTDGQVSVIDPGNGEWGYQTQTDSFGDCKRVAISRIIIEKMELGFVPFLIKIDIEEEKITCLRHKLIG